MRKLRSSDLDVTVTAKQLVYLDGDDGLMANGRIAPGSVPRVDRALVTSPAKVHVTDGKETGWAFSILDLSFSVRLPNGLGYELSPHSA